MESLFQWLFQQSFGSWCLLVFLGNIVAAGLSVLCCWLCGQAFRHDRLFAHSQPFTTSDVAFSAGAVVLNSLIGVLGWWLWQRGWIVLCPTTLASALIDTLLLIMVMDLSMYFFHWIAHYPRLYRIVHRSHHTHHATNPLSLFVLNPFEALGFGLLLIVVLMVIPLCGGALIAYLSINMIFGTMGHLGLEPIPHAARRHLLLRYLGTSTFHALHHADEAHNFGFYTTIWDRLFRTLHPEYDARFQAAEIRPIL